MRELTKKQKKLLTEVLERFEPSHDDRLRYGERHPIQSVNDLPINVWHRLKEMNFTEILYGEVNRFIDDWHWERIKI